MIKTKKLLAKTTLIILVFSLFLPSLTFLSYPNKSQAAGIPVFDISTFTELTTLNISSNWTAIKSTFTSLSTALTQTNTYMTTFKEFVLDGVAGSVAKAMIRQMTKSAVRWINSGFEGSPSFLSNPERFFANTIDEAVGTMINGYKLDWLCSPFSAQIKTSIARQYNSYYISPKRCTLTDVVNNISSANVSYNPNTGAITAGVSGSGRGNRSNNTTMSWNSFLERTTIPTNTPFGAMQAASIQADRAVNTKIDKNNTDLDRGNGFFSWKTCKTYSKESECLESGAVAGYDSEGNEVQNMDCVKYGEPKCLEYETQTPGSVIEGQINSILPSDIKQLELADEINEIISALMGQVLNQVLGSGGLLGLSNTGSDGSSRMSNISDYASAAASAANKDSQTSFDKEREAAEQEANNAANSGTYSGDLTSSTTGQNIIFNDNASSTIKIYKDNTESFSNILSFYTDYGFYNTHITISLLKNSSSSNNYLPLSTIFKNLKTKITQEITNTDSQTTLDSNKNRDTANSTMTIYSSLNVEKYYTYNVSYSGTIKSVSDIPSGSYILRTEVRDENDNTIGFQDISFIVLVL